MYSIAVNGSNSHQVNVSISTNRFEGTFNNKKVSGDLVKINDCQYHLIYDKHSYNIDVIKVNSAEKSLLLKINSQKFNLTLKDKYDELLHTLGLDALASKKINDVKAPMPGMVLNILVSEGQEVKKGDALLVLEAMKMENILKSPSDGVIKKIAAVKGTAVEKNQLLLQF